MKSTHIPEFAAGSVSVTGSEVVKTGLREIQGCSAVLDGTITANEESAVTATVQNANEILIRVYKGGTGSGTAGDSAVTVNWMALGK